jgi:hypothetical protein
MYAMVQWSVDCVIRYWISIHQSNTTQATKFGFTDTNFEIEAPISTWRLSVNDFKRMNNESYIYKDNFIKSNRAISAGHVLVSPWLKRPIRCSLQAANHTLTQHLRRWSLSLFKLKAVRDLLRFGCSCTCCKLNDSGKEKKVATVQKPKGKAGLLVHCCFSTDTI